MEKQEEKQRKHIEKQQQKQKRDNDSIYDDMSTQGDYNSDYQSNKSKSLYFFGVLAFKENVLITIHKREV